MEYILGFAIGLLVCLILTKLQQASDAKKPKKVYVVSVERWNGTHSSFHVHSVHTEEVKAKQVCRVNNKGNTSSYAPHYTYEARDLEKE